MEGQFSTDPSNIVNFNDPEARSAEIRRRADVFEAELERKNPGQAQGTFKNTAGLMAIFDAWVDIQRFETEQR